MTGQTEPQQQQDQVATALLTMAAIMCAAVAILSAAFWSDLTSAVVFGFLTVAMIGTLVSLPTQREPLAPSHARRQMKLLFLVATGVWVIAALMAVGLAIQSNGSTGSVIWVATCSCFSLMSLLAARRYR